MSETQITKVPIKDMFIDRTYQRPLVESKIDQLGRIFDRDAIGVLVLSYRQETDQYAVIDGQHRRHLMIAKGYHNDSVWCEVFFELTLEDEAKLFKERNTRTNVGRLDLFRAMVAAQEPAAVKLNGIFDKYHWEIAAGNRSNKKAQIRAIAAFEIIFAMPSTSPINAAEQTLEMITSAWGYGKWGVESKIVKGMGQFFARYGTAVDVKTLRERLAAFPNGALGLLGKANSLAATMRISANQAVSMILVEEHNKYKRSNALGPWQ